MERSQFTGYNVGGGKSSRPVFDDPYHQFGERVIDGVSTDV